MFGLKSVVCGLGLITVLALPAVAGEKQVILNRKNAFKASYTEAIASSKEGNLYVLSLSDALAGMLKIKVTNKTTSFTPQVVITDKEKKELLNRSAEAAGGDIPDLQLRVGTGKKYFITLKDYSEQIVTTPYTVELQVVPVPNKYAPNNDFSSAKPIKLGEEIQVTVFAPVEETYHNYFQFSLPSDTTVEVRIQGVRDMTPHIVIYNQHKEEVHQASASQDGADLHTEVALPGGSYYIMVQDYSDNSSVIPFRLMLKVK